VPDEIHPRYYLWTGNRLILLHSNKEKNRAVENYWTSHGQTSARDRRLITYARGLNISRLDRRLPNRRFEHWFRSLVGTNATITWEINDCGEQSGNPKDGSSINPPLRAQVERSLPDSRQVSVLILVGTHKAGRTGKPIIWSMSLVDKGAVKYPGKLRELQTLMHG